MHLGVTKYAKSFTAGSSSSENFVPKLECMKSQDCMENFALDVCTLKSQHSSAEILPKLGINDQWAG